jgi:hypothetical protein
MLAFKVKTDGGGLWKLEPTAELLAVEAFRIILNHADTPAQALQDMLFVWGMEERRSPFGTTDMRLREMHVRRNVYGQPTEGPKEGEQRYERIEWGRAAYIEYVADAGDRLLEDMDGAIDDVRAYIRNLRSKGITDDSSAKSLISALAQVNSVLESKKKAEKLIREGLDQSSTKMKGGANRSPLELGLVDNVLGNGVTGSRVEVEAEANAK